MKAENRYNLNSAWGRLVVEELLRCGVDYFCISPGSRSTPLVAAVAQNSRAKSIVCYDERSSAFHALGYGRAAGKPAAVITTSGTAAANLYPAVVEAAVDKIPLLLLTADRPPELIDTGANQAMNQDSLFGRFVRRQFDLPTPAEEIPPQMVLTTIDQAVFRSRYNNPGPVHINCRYRKPLQPQDTAVDEGYTAGIQRWRQSKDPFTSYTAPCVTPADNSFESLCAIIDKTDRGMIVAGRLDSAEQRTAVLKLAGKLNWTVYADVTSGLRFTGAAAHVIRYFDQELLSPRFNEQVAPTTVLHVGGRTTSRRIGLFFNANSPANYIVIKDSPERHDPIHAVTMHIQSDIAAACNRIADTVRPRGADQYAAFFDQRAAQAQQIIAERIEQDDCLSEPFVARHIAEAAPAGSGLFLSNSMPIRDVDLYGLSPKKNIAVAANRGVSGIDGIISTASGFAVQRASITTVLIGDMAFIHDLNALSILARLSAGVIVVVINNRGGGIFHFLPISQHADIFEEFFAAPHDFSFGGVCGTFGLDHYHCRSKSDFVESYQTAVDKGVAAVIEVATDRQDNLKLRRSMKRKIIDMLNESVNKQP
ncbi:MAG: 2-succinyl-5-enolpyruvyl-6-hydroxy-3-cyclohexene-1-carboxylic-acid synthase [Planctomycetota bacterium]|nr:MAG: 2-succinyl-5-enolpyruvyl-6-hydroxy-3-cyclohexene-1-carboxylic-acid synthase [Planctomycetota bacterium]